METNTQTEPVNGSDSPDVAIPQAAETADVDKLRADLNRANKEAAERRVALKAAQAELDALKAAQAAAAEKAMTEQGQYQALYETEKKRAADLEAQAADLQNRIKANELAMLRHKVATEKGLPAALAARLQGETEDEISADADELLKAIPRPSAPDLDGGARGAGRGIAPQEAASILNRYNIDPRYLKES